MKSNLRLAMEGGASGAVVAELGDVEYLCPPGVSIPIPVRNSVMDPAEYWLGFEVHFRCPVCALSEGLVLFDFHVLTQQTTADGELKMEVMVAPPDGSTPHRRIPDVPPATPPRSQFMSVLTSPDADVLSPGTSPTAGQSTSVEEVLEAVAAAPPVTPPRQLAVNTQFDPPLDTLLQVKTVGVQCGLRVDTAALVEAVSSGPASVDVLSVSCKPASTEPSDGHLVQVAVPQWCSWWLKANSVQVCVHRICAFA
jgi:hypothetical protein